MIPSARIVIATPFARFDALMRSLVEHHGYEVLRLRHREQLTVEALEAFGPSHVVFPHWSWKIPPEIHQRFECVIFHMTDVPYGRGGSPLQNLVVRGVEQTCLTALRCSDEMDAGPVYTKQPLSTLGTAEEVMLRAAVLMEPIVRLIVEQGVQPQPQQGEIVAFKRRHPKDGDLSGVSDLRTLFDHIRMLDGEGYLPAFVDAGAFRLEFTRASLRADSLIADVRIRLVDQRGTP